MNRRPQPGPAIAGPRATVTLTFALAIFSALLTASCGGSAGSVDTLTGTPNVTTQGVAPSPSISVTPAAVRVPVGGTSVAFAATFSTGTGGAVEWQVNGVPGGNATVGTISPSGQYVSPGVLPAPATLTVTAVAASDTSKTGTATILLTAPGITVTVSPSQATVTVGQAQSFAATVTNAANTAVDWQVNGVAGGNSSVGTISSSGLYVAPAVPPAQPIVTITALSTEDATKSGSATVLVAPAPPVVSVTVVPAAATIVAGSGTQAFAATVSGTNSTAVTWLVNGVTGGNATFGTISAGGLYAAPAGVPSQAVTVTAVSVADPTRSSSAAVTVTPPVTVAVSPAAASVQAGNGTQQFNAAVTNAANGGVTWQVNGVTGGNATFGTITASGLYTAPASVPSQAVAVTAVSVAAPGSSATAAVTVTPPVLVSVSPTAASVQAGIGSQLFRATVANATNTAVTWQVNGVTGGNATVGTISTNGLYTAPVSMPAQAVTVTAVSVASPTRSASAAVTVTAPVSVTLSPAAANVQAGIGTQQFTATVAHSANTAVSWQVNGVTGGNATVGTISQGGLYSAPAAAPALAITVMAIAAADPTRVGTAAITVTSPVTVAVSPTTASVQAGIGLQQFTATVGSAINTAVTWQVNGVAGGSAASGTISSTGLYTAPASVPSPATVSVTATSIADPTRSATATVTVTAAVSVAVSPSSASVSVGSGTRLFTATVTNTTNTAVTWLVNGVSGGNSTLGTISASGQYTAPATIPSPATVTVTARSVADPTRSASAAVTVVAAVTVSVSPSIASLTVGTGTQPFAATVTGGTLGTVTWQVNGQTGGNAATGTIATNGIYTVPATVPSPATVTVTAVSNDDPTRSASATVNLRAATSAPKISGVPSTTGAVGQAYSFQPTASGGNGGTLVFSIANKPAWATFSTATGLLSGTPAAGDIGTYANVSIAVSDGTNSATLPAFTITVNAGASGSATLSWVAPTLQTDGSPLTDLVGFRVYYGTNASSLTSRVDVANPTVTTTVVSSLTTGTWYFAITAVDANGNESAYSNVASKTI